jgi:hypothetical protein
VPPQSRPLSWGITARGSSGTASARADPSAGSGAGAGQQRGPALACRRTGCGTEASALPGLEDGAGSPPTARVAAYGPGRRLRPGSIRPSRSGHPDRGHWGRPPGFSVRATHRARTTGPGRRPPPLAANHARPTPHPWTARSQAFLLGSYDCARQLFAGRTRRSHLSVGGASGWSGNITARDNLRRKRSWDTTTRVIRAGRGSVGDAS